MKLEKCPFCGGEAIVVKTERCGRYIGCWDCGGRTEAFETDYAGSAHDKAISAWNRRAPSCEIQQYAESCADCGFCNAPLTLDELRGMDGEPVYLQFGDGVCGWAIVLIDGDWITFECPDFDGHCEPDVDFINMEYNDPDGHFGLHILGWRALRRKPEPGKEEPT